MIDEIKIWIINIVTIIIFISFLEILMPSSKTKKYLNLILGFVVMLVILNPIINLLNENAYLEEEFFKISNSLDKEEYAFAAQNIESFQQEQLLTLYKANIIDELKGRVESKYGVQVSNIRIDLEDEDKTRLGDITGIQLTVFSDEVNEGDAEIPIVTINVFEEAPEIDENSYVLATLKSEIKKDIAGSYNIKEDFIIVN